MICKNCGKDIEKGTEYKWLWFHCATGMYNCNLVAEPEIERPKATRQERATKGTI